MPGGPVADPWEALRRLTPARIGLGHTGVSLPTVAHLAFQLAHARARDAVHDALDADAALADLAARGLDGIAVRSAAAHRRAYLQRPDLGRRLHPASRSQLDALAPSLTPLDLVLVLADGLSARAAARHGPALLERLVPRLRREGWRIAPVVVALQGRVALGDDVGTALGARIAAVLVGERPGLSSPYSLGAYLTWDPRPGRLDAERNCLSNIRPEGLAYDPAADRLHFLLTEARRRKLTGVSLKDDRTLPAP
jgi:ethanolamine ammonia-lyase small subunit